MSCDSCGSTSSTCSKKHTPTVETSPFKPDRNLSYHPPPCPKRWPAAVNAIPGTTMSSGTRAPGSSSGTVMATPLAANQSRKTPRSGSPLTGSNTITTEGFRSFVISINSRQINSDRRPTSSRGSSRRHVRSSDRIRDFAALTASTSAPYFSDVFQRCRKRLVSNS